jgi:hypothetical protein
VQLTNEQVARALKEVADLLESQAANPFRVSAYRAGARTVAALAEPVLEILAEEGRSGLLRLPGIGESLATAIEQLVATGRLERLERLRGEVRASDRLTSLPGIGPEMAERIRSHLQIDTLEQLESAAYDGRLESVSGIGRKRIQAIRESLATRFRRDPNTPRPRPKAPAEQPDVGELLSIDREYREASDERRVTNIAPRRFNPTGAAWLPVMRVTRGNRHYTALFSNTARAHTTEGIHDWVIIRCEDPGHEGQWTVITSQYGRLRGRRIVRGREAECLRYYQDQRVQQELSLDSP